MRRLLLVIAAVTVVLLPACGDDDGGGNELGAVQLVSRAADAAVEEGTARFSVSIDTQGAGGLAVDARGLTEFDTNRMSMTMTLPDVAGMDLGELSAVIDGTTMYFQMAELQDLMGIDTSWLSMDIGRLAEVQGLDLSQLQSAANTNPTEVLGILQGASDDMEEVGTEEIRGEETTHYRGTVDLRKAAELQGLDSAQLDEMLDQFGRDTLPMDVWIDDAGRPRRMAFTGSTTAGDEELSLEVTLDLFDYGVDEQVEIPSADDVTDITDQVVGAADAISGN